MLAPVLPMPVVFPPVPLDEEEEIITMDVPAGHFVVFEVADDEVIEVHNDSVQAFTTGLNELEDTIFFFYNDRPITALAIRDDGNELIKEMRIVVTQENDGRMRFDIQNEHRVSLLEGEIVYLN